MAIDFVQKAQFLKAELNAFDHALSHTKEETAKMQACRRLRKALNQVEALAEDPGGLWDYLPEEQRWGWLRLVSYVGTAMHELKRLERENKREERRTPRFSMPLPGGFGAAATSAFSAS